MPLIHLGLCTTDLRTAPLQVTVPVGQVKTYTVLAAVYTTLDHPSPLAPAARDLRTSGPPMHPTDPQFVYHDDGLKGSEKKME